MQADNLKLVAGLSPLIVGGIIAVVNSDRINERTERMEAWMRDRQLRASMATHWSSRYLLNPVLWVIVRFYDLTTGLAHRGLKNGVRVAASLYLIVFWIYLLDVAIGFAIALLILYIIIKVLLRRREPAPTIRTDDHTLIDQWQEECGCKKCNTYAIMRKYHCGCVEVDIHRDGAPCAECTNFSAKRFTAYSCR